MPIFKDVGIDTDNDGERNELDEDDDNDGIFDVDDACPLDPSPGCSMGDPITDTVMIDGREWAQVDLFKKLSWNDMNAVCPAGVCSGSLDGHAMLGWTWASREDVTELFDYYVCGPSDAGCFTGLESEANSAWAPMMFADGMRSTFTTGDFRVVGAHVSDENLADPAFVYTTMWWDYLPLARNDTANDLFSLQSVEGASGYDGGWFYRDLP